VRVSYLFHSTTALIALSFCAHSASAASLSPVGVWIDHTGRGAVEIKPCGKKLCGHVVWARSRKDSKKGCGKKIIGNLRKVGSKTWDRGWIYSPERGRKFDLEVRPLNKNKLRILGYMGNKLFSKTMYWKRAPASLKRCDQPPVNIDKPIIAKKTPATPAGTTGLKTAKAKANSKTGTKTRTARATTAIIPPKPKRVERIAPKKTQQASTPEKEARIASREPALKTPNVINQPPKAQEERESYQEANAGGRDYDDNEEATAENENEPVKKQRTTRYKKKKRCTISAPFVTVSFPCNK